MSSDLSRRDFVALAGAGAAAALLSGCHTAASGASPAMTTSPLPAGPLTVLFQGDSITDAGRNRNSANANEGGALGTGYPLLIAAAALRAHPDHGLRFFNRGVSGNKVPDLEARWAADTIAIKPDVLSILIGVNDIWHKLNGNYNGTVKEYEDGLTALLAATLRMLPNVKLIVLEPFVTRTGAVSDRWFPEFDERRAACARVARGAGATFIPLQRMFDELSKQSSPAFWAADGVHPTPAGHAAIAEQWRAAAGI